MPPDNAVSALQASSPDVGTHSRALPFAITLQPFGPPGGCARQRSHSFPNRQLRPPLHDSVLGLKTDANFSQKAPSSNAWVGYAKQHYAYDPQLDYLTSASYDDDGNGTWEATHTWTYNAAGNRQTASAQPGTWAYDNLNRMTTSPMGPYENDILGNRLWQNHFQQGGRRMEWDAGIVCRLSLVVCRGIFRTLRCIWVTLFRATNDRRQTTNEMGLRLVRRRVVHQQTHHALLLPFGPPPRSLRSRPSPFSFASRGGPNAHRGRLYAHGAGPGAGGRHPRRPGRARHRCDGEDHGIRHCHRVSAPNNAGFVSCRRAKIPEPLVSSRCVPFSRAGPFGMRELGGCCIGFIPSRAVAFRAVLSKLAHPRHGGGTGFSRPHATASSVAAPALCAIRGYKSAAESA